MIPGCQNVNSLYVRSTRSVVECDFSCATPDFPALAQASYNWHTVTWICVIFAFPNGDHLMDVDGIRAGPADGNDQPAAEPNPAADAPPPVSQQQEQDAMTASNNRMKRNQLLAASDWTQMPDSPLTDEAKTSWATYRSALRDLPSSSDWPDVTFPTEPS